jgi:hypothetical protein
MERSRGGFRDEVYNAPGLITRTNSRRTTGTHGLKVTFDIHWPAQINHEVWREPKAFQFHCGIFSQLTDRTSGSMLRRDITSWIARSLRSTE